MKISLRKINCILLVFAMILGGTIEIKYLDGVSFPTSIIPWLPIVFSVIGIILESKAKISVRAGQFLFVFAAYLLIYILVKRFNISSYLKRFFVVLLLFYIYSHMLIKSGKFQTFLDTYENVFIIIGLITLFFWIFGSILNILPGRMDTSYSFGNYTGRGYTYFYLYFENFRQNQKLLGVTFPRNCGIYCEAPAYSGMLLYAVGIELFSHETINRKKLIALLATVISTQSTKALVILIIVFGLRYITKNGSMKTKPFRFVFSIILIVVASALIWYVLEDKSTANYSFASRINHLKAGFNTWLSNPLFGVGYRNVSAVIDNESEGVGYGGLSMGITVLLAQGGLYLFAMYFAAPFVAARSRAISRNIRNYVLFIVIVTVNLFVSNSAFTYPYLFMVAAAFAAGVTKEPSVELAGEGSQA